MVAKSPTVKVNLRNILLEETETKGLAEQSGCFGLRPDLSPIFHLEQDLTSSSCLKHHRLKVLIRADNYELWAEIDRSCKLHMVR